MRIADGLAVLLGERPATRVPLHWVRRIAAGVFGVFGLLSLATLL